jgi:hypothetical protein
MRRFVLALALTSFLITGGLFSASALDDPSTGSARLHQVDRSGITARIVFLDTGDPTTGLIVSGTAKGLDPEDTYITLVYDDGSVPGGPLACEPPPDNDQTEAQMFVGTWVVAPDGTGTLNATKTGASYVPLDDIGTVSVREVVEVGLPELEACGKVHRNP